MWRHLDVTTIVQRATGMRCRSPLKYNQLCLIYRPSLSIPQISWKSLAPLIWNITHRPIRTGQNIKAIGWSHWNITNFVGARNLQSPYYAVMHKPFVFSCLWRLSAQGCAFCQICLRVSLICLPIYGVRSPKFLSWAWRGIFKPNSQHSLYYNSGILSKERQRPSIDYVL